jgi:hypothetical protein
MCGPGKYLNSRLWGIDIDHITKNIVLDKFPSAVQSGRRVLVVGFVIRCAGGLTLNYT